MKFGVSAASPLLFSPPGRALPKIAATDIEALAKQIRETPRERILDWAGTRIGQGLDYKTMLGAVFLAGLHEIKPWYVGGKLHAVIMVSSILDLTESADSEEAWLGALWNLDDMKLGQQRDINEGDWVLPPKPSVSFADEAKARTAFLAAMEAWDPEAADRALLGLMSFHRRDTLFEILWPFAARCYENIGHKIIYAAQVERTLRRLGWAYAEPALRSLVLGLLFKAPGITGTFTSSLSLAPSFPENWMAGKSDPASSQSLLAPLRTAGSEEAQKLVIAALTEGLGPQTVWDGLRLFAAELFLRHPRVEKMANRAILLPVHAVTVTNAFGYAFRLTTEESTRRILLLQAAAFLALLRDDLSNWIKLSMEGPGIDQLGAEFKGETVGLEQSYAEYSAASAKELLDRNPALAHDFRRDMRTALLHKGVEHHQHKFAAAIWEESLLVDPRWQSRILAPSVTYLNPNEPDTEFQKRALQVLRKVNL